MKLLFTLLAVVFAGSVNGTAQTPPAAAATSASSVSTQQFQWAQLNIYHDADAQVPPPVAGENRVVFFGDSITQAWTGNDFFPGKNYINRGISGQTTTQMLVRFPQDVLQLKPAVVLILAGTNDIAQNQGPISLEDIARNLEALAQTARDNHVTPVLCSILPALEYPWRPGLQPAEKVMKINSLLAAWCKAHHVIYCDYFPALVDDKKGMKADLAKDGIHPNSAGYAVMMPIAQKAIDEALAKRAH